MILLSECVHVNACLKESGSEVGNAEPLNWVMWISVWLLSVLYSYFLPQASLMIVLKPILRFGCMSFILTCN